MKQPPTELIITALSTPNSKDPPDASDFYAALGQFSVAWGRLEGHLCGCLLTIMALTNYQKNLPLTWKERAALWEDGFSAITELHHLRYEAEAFIHKLLDEAEDRNMAAHAIWGGFVSGELEPTMTVRWLRKPLPPAKGILVDDRRITLTSVKEAVRMANRLNAGMLKFSVPLHALRPIPNDAVTL